MEKLSILNLGGRNFTNVLSLVRTWPNYYWGKWSGEFLLNWSNKCYLLSVYTGNIENGRSRTHNAELIPMYSISKPHVI